MIRGDIDCRCRATPNQCKAFFFYPKWELRINGASYYPTVGNGTKNTFTPKLLARRRGGELDIIMPFTHLIECETGGDSRR